MKRSCDWLRARAGLTMILKIGMGKIGTVSKRAKIPSILKIHAPGFIPEIFGCVYLQNATSLGGIFPE
jgi:hypothetical protein